MTGVLHKSSHRVLVFGGTGTAGQGAVRALIAKGYDVTCIVRSLSDMPPQVTQVQASVTGTLQDIRSAIAGQTFDVVVSCLASRSGNPKDAWAIDYAAHINILELAKEVDAAHVILVSALCVQKPKLEFQRAKLAFEDALISSGLTYSIVRPTAFFKSLSGQIDRVRQGKPFLVFGDGTLTSCKPISDDDLGRFIAECITDVRCHNEILPIGGPGPAITPLDQADALSRLMGKPVPIRRVPVAVINTIYKTLKIAGLVSAKAKEKAELARIGHYYATESMLVWNSDTGHYDADMTTSTGTETLFDFYADVISKDASVSRAEHTVF